jgi:hypothetical protein
VCESKDKPRYIDEFLAERFFVRVETIEFFYIYSFAETFSSLNIYSSRCCKIKQGINRMFLISAGGEKEKERKSIILNMANMCVGRSFG